MEHLSGRVFDIQRWSLHDGPGIRTNVFLKGCPLRCIWCCNPESQEGRPELAYFIDKCIRCGRCVALCPYGAIDMHSNAIRTDRSVCTTHCYKDGSFPCLGRCYSGARKLIGPKMTVEEVLREVMKDALIYEQSGGGVTFTGGEPMYQFAFLKALAQACKQSWLHVAMETCGYASWKKYQQILELVDFVFLDIKLLDNQQHKKLVGRPNKMILDNAVRIAEHMRLKQGTVVVRTPVVPGITDADTIAGIAAFVRKRMPGVATYELMAYHRFGRGKYNDIGRDYPLPDLEPEKPGDLALLRDVVSSHGLLHSYQPEQ
jgi:pyruvate formate lyase activating enzyme